MALRVYQGGYLVRNKIAHDPGVEVVRELESYASRASFRLKLLATEERPKIGDHILVRDDRQLLRNSNRLDQTGEWEQVDVDPPTATWGALPSQIGGNGLRWTVEESATDGLLRNTTVLVEHPIPQFTSEIALLETRYFVFSIFVKRTVASATCKLQSVIYNGDTTDTTTVTLNTSTGAVSTSGSGTEHLDESDADWYRLAIVHTATPPVSGSALPEVRLEFLPGTSAEVCCAQITEVSNPDLASAYSWGEASLAWASETLTWDEYGSPALYLPAYLDRRNVSANEFVGIVGEVSVEPCGNATSYVWCDVLAVDYRVKFNRTLVTETYTSQTDQAIITDLISTYAPYLTGTLYSGAASAALTFSWAGVPLDECLDQISAQVEGKQWRIHPDAYLQWGMSRVEAVGYTFGDSHNLLEWSNDPSTRQTTIGFQSGWLSVPVVDANLTPVSGANPFDSSGGSWSVEDDDAAGTLTLLANIGISTDPDSDGYLGPVLLANRRYYTGVHVKKGSATNGIISLQYRVEPAGSFGYVDLNVNTGALSTGGTAQSVFGPDGSEWFVLEASNVIASSSSTQFAQIAIFPARIAAFGDPGDSSLTGSVTIACAFFTWDESLRYVETEAFAAFPSDNTLWSLRVSGQDARDLANKITVKSDEAGTYSDTAEDTDSQAEYGLWEPKAIIDSTLGSNAACLRRAKAEIALRAWPRESVIVECRGKTNLDVGMLAVVTQSRILQHRAVGQIIQRYTLRYRNRNDALITLEMAPFVTERVTKALRAALAT